MRRVLFSVALAAGLVLSVAATGAGTSSVKATLSGKCSQVDTLDKNGALQSTRITCTVAAKCACAGSTSLDYVVVADESGTGAPGRESGTLTASGPLGTLTFQLKGKHTAIGGGTGTWKLVKTVGYKGVQLTRSGTYTTTTKTLKQIPLSRDTLVKVSAILGCWRC